MTYGNEQGWLKLRKTLRRLPDELMDISVGGPPVRLLICHLPLGLAADRCKRERFLNSLGPSSAHVFPLPSRSPIFRPHLPVDLASGKYVSARRYRKGHPESGQKARPIKGSRPKAEICPHSAAQTSETVRPRLKIRNVALSRLMSSLEKRSRCAFSDSSHPVRHVDRGYS